MDGHTSVIDAGRITLSVERDTSGFGVKLTARDDITWDEFVELLRTFSLAVGFAPRTVEEFFDAPCP